METPQWKLMLPTPWAAPGPIPLSPPFPRCPDSQVSRPRGPSKAYSPTRVEQCITWLLCFDAGTPVLKC